VYRNVSEPSPPTRKSAPPPTKEEVVARLADEDVVGVAARQVVRAATAKGRVGARFTDQQVAPSPPLR
jgi:hypothetical protein